MRAGTCASTARKLCRTSKRRRGERGAALVEFAILLPLVMLITFGVIEFSAAYQSSSIATAAARTAARTASAEALLSTYSTDAATAAATALRTAPNEEPQEMWIYRANTQGLPESGGFSSCTTHCISYQWNKNTKSFDTTLPGGSGWPSSQQNACNQANWDSVGVYIRLNHKYLTRLFGSTLTLTDHAVFRLEPAPTQLCP
jgi:Flp pilus assembly protein TadG